ncbi:hypothetical protein AXF42_Ash004675 [Apostasia shenzhenica]|uniref:Hemerythrin-like domain-containing protein n=1 Tax=Apostasia shenzhenica TaxID=1088818 RepID=A0A2I0BHA2_9ASPA|nr:hypothetical protein AXF42_Ash004675 [Apostasia shenzhenica]
MGNCSPKPMRRPPKQSKPLVKASPPAVELHGSDSCPVACRIRVALLYKRVAVEFVEAAGCAGVPFLRCGSEIMAGSEDSLLRQMDKRFGGPPAAAPATEEGPWFAKEAAAAEVVTLQHRSMLRHVEGMVRWAVKLAAEGGGEDAGGLGLRRGRAAEVRRMGKWYGELREIMLEHAQMEERLLFPALDRAADYEKCRTANEQHGRDLPIMNGVREDIKSLMAMDAESHLFAEALFNLSLRFKTLQEHCKQHFEEEEKELLPLLEVAEGARREEGEEPWPADLWVEKVAAMMEATHGSLFPFFMAALLPHDAMRYVELVAGGDDRRAIAMLRLLAAAWETLPRPSWLLSNGTD